MHAFWEIITALQHTREEELIKKLNNIQEYNTVREKIDSLLNKVDDPKLRIELADTYCEQETIYNKELYLAGLRDGFKLSEILKGDCTMNDLWTEEYNRWALSEEEA